MANEYITESIKDAKDHLNSIMDQRGMPHVELAIAERILRSCKSFLHGKNLEDWNNKLKKVEMEYQMEKKKAEVQIRKDFDNDYLYYSALADYELQAWIKKVEWIIAQLDELNGTI